jgi:3-deoxy-D-manno-octulosonic-acid transferase
MPFMNAMKDRLKFIVAPHEISEGQLTTIKTGFLGKTIRFSRVGGQEVQDAQLLLVDTIGMLSRLYRYGEYAFVGGGYKEGLHNILEAAAYGIPVFFGSKAPYDKYQEALDLTRHGGAFAVADTAQLTRAFDALYKDQSSYDRAARTCGEYVRKNRGATGQITMYLLQTLDAWKAG